MSSADSGPDARLESGENLDELLARVARGDRDAFGAVYDAVSGPVMGLVARILRDPALAEEVTQDVLLEVWRTSGRFSRELGTAMAWVMVLAHRRAVDRVRSTQAVRDREHRAALLAHTTPFDEVTEQVETRMEQQELRRCLRSLTEIQRQSICLAYYEGMTYREVAESLQLPLGTVKTRLRDGLIRLRDCLGESRQH
ncbi:ECF RNA polymerase sigma factor SigK [Streptomyces sp. NPDC051219]|uniref:ECF RNA polymerase sigma factor SigK n=1 Tax=Streptomyces sp. NPDC051219 TaxID=3155283 RepID=UPI0034391201